VPQTPTPPPPIPATKTIAEVVDALGSIIDWSIKASSRLGYFAALYKKVTIAVGVAVTDGKFEDGARLERLDAGFANRYFDALNGHFHPTRFPRPTHSWQVTFDAAARPEPILAQHMFAGVNAHIGLDLGIVAEAISPGPRLFTLREDFNRINAVLASQVKGVVEDINELSPVLADLFAVLQQAQIKLINETVEGYRDSAWRFATVLAATPGFADPAAIVLRDIQIAQHGALIYRPPVPLSAFVGAIAAQESRDIVSNIEALDEIASTPAAIETTL
jgi:Family of unknown function (DUF5995)